MRSTIGLWIGLGLVLTGCGAAPVATTLPAPTEASVQDPVVVPAVHPQRSSLVQGSEATASLLITFQNPRTSFSSDKIDLTSGQTLPVDDGMGPDGDISFFFDGSEFQVIANAGGGANRTLAPAQGGKPTAEFAMAPIPVKEGSEVLVKRDGGVVSVRITGLEPGSMTFEPTGVGTGTGSVAFSYHVAAH